jgi:hypothetical protein
MKNEANFGGSFKCEVCRGRPPCLPIRRAATGGRPYAPQTPHSAEGRSCETNPIRYGTMESQVLYDKEVRSDLPPDWEGETKPIPGGAGWDGACRTNKANLPAGTSRGEGQPPTWANSAKQSQFPPAGGSGPGGEGWGVPYEQSQFARWDKQGRGPEPRPGPILRNKANSRRRVGRGPGGEGRGVSYKQSQLGLIRSSPVRPVRDVERTVGLPAPCHRQGA